MLARNEWVYQNDVSVLRRQRRHSFFLIKSNHSAQQEEVERGEQTDF
jgi:hypothetical protein